MSDRYAKKARVLFDAKEKEKHRVAALDSIIEMMESDKEREVFFRDNLEYIAQLTVDSFTVSAEKIESQKEYRERFEKALIKDHLKEVFAFPRMTRWVIEYGGPGLYELPVYSGMIECLRRLLAPTSHPMLRREGMQLVFFWMKRRVTDEIRLIFASAVELRQFCADPSLDIGQPEYPQCGKPLVEAPLSKQTQAETLFDDILHLMTFDPDATRPSLTLLYKELQKAYLSILYPSVFAEYKLIKMAEGGFVREAPARLQVILIKYIILWLQRDPNWPQPDRIPVACFIFEEMLLSSPIDSEIIHEILRQALLLPFDQFPTIKSVLGLLRWWVFQPAARRPQFLREDLHGMLPSDLAETIEAGLMETYTDRYIRRIQSVFDGRPSFNIEDRQIDVYRDAMAFLRAIAMGHYYKPTEKIWSSLINTVLAIATSHLCSKETFFTKPDLFKSFSTSLIETIVGVYVRSGTQDRSNYEKLMVVMSKAVKWPSVVMEWSRTVQSLTALLISTTLSSETKSSTDKQNMERMSSFEAVTLELLTGPELAAPRQDTFLTWSHNLVGANLTFLWRNWIRAIGNPTAIENPDNHDYAVRTLVSLWNRMDKAKSNPNGQVIIPRLHEFTEALFDSFEQQLGRPFENSRCTIIACLSRMFTRPIDNAAMFSDSFVPRYYLAIINGLVDKDSKLAQVTLRSSSHLFSSSLPSPSVLVPSFLKCIGATLNGHLPSSEVLVSMIRLVTAMAVLPDTYPKLDVPRIEAPLPSMSQVPISHAGDIALDESIRQQSPCLLQLIEDQFKSHDIRDSTVHAAFLDALTVLLLNEFMAQAKPNTNLIDQYLTLLMNEMDSPYLNEAALLSSIDAVSSVATQELMDANRQKFVTQSLLALLDSSVKETRTVILLRGLSIWFMALPSDYLELNESVCSQLLTLLLSCIERGNETGRAAELFITHLVHQLGNEPLRKNALLKDNQNISLAIGTDALLGITQDTDGLAIEFQDNIGSFAWNFTPLTPKDDSIIPRESFELGQAMPVDHLEPYRVVNVNPVPKGEIPTFSEETNLEETDMLAGLLSYLDCEFPEMTENTTGPDYASPDRREAVVEMRDACEELIRLESELNEKCKALTKTMKATADSRLSHQIAKPSPSGPSQPSKFHQGRALLAQLGLLTNASKKGGSTRFPTQLLGPSKGLAREWSRLERLSCHHQHKVALIYYGPTCHDEETIFGDVETSASYDNFAASLGAYHKVEGLQYTAGLTQEDTAEALYYTCPAYELVFHESSNISGDLVQKKRHIGNDAVFIVWNENQDTPYSPSLIKSDFGNYQIVITPKAKDGLYAINIYADSTGKISLGPLFDGALVPRALLAPLVRATAVAADRALSIDAHSVHLSHADERQKSIALTVEKQALATWTAGQVLAHIACPLEYSEEHPSVSPVVI